ncbi:MAG TPA: hypothetical protein VM864_12035 [Pyrinomonadaceae bacterium]|jgi:hypothetical protein|nr:hypothetical protein [Pyrinomonadaceae bacterium]
MIVLISILIGALAIGVLLTLASENFADGVSRVMEAAFDAVEYRLAVSEERAAREGREAGEVYERGAAAVV